MTTLTLLELFLGFMTASVALWAYSLAKPSSPQN